MKRIKENKIIKYLNQKLNYGGKVRDYCTLVPDHLGSLKSWRGACASHDQQYAEIRELRLRADKQFKKDMERYSWKWLANIYYKGVRIFGGLAV